MSSATLNARIFTPYNEDMRLLLKTVFFVFEFFTTDVLIIKIICAQPNGKKSQTTPSKNFSGV
jgi:hypothetical protein